MKIQLSKNMSRRSVLKGLLGLSALGLLMQWPREVFADDKQPEMKLIDDAKDQMAKSMNYHHDKKKIPKNFQIERMGVAFKEQNCGNCMFYIDPKGMIKKDNVGTCRLIPGGVVKEKGSCATWAKKV